MKRTCSVLFVTLLLIISAQAAAPKIETIGKFIGAAPEAIHAALAESGYRVTGSDHKVLAEIWPAKSGMAQKSGESNALFPEFVRGAFYGIISFPNGTGDYRGQKIAAGTYTLRYELLPGDGNHLGVAPNPDFFLLVPVASDPDPAVKLEYAALVQLSAKSSGASHPAPFALVTPAAKPVDASEDQGHTIAFFPINTSEGVVNVGMILSGASDEQ